MFLLFFCNFFATLIRHKLTQFFLRCCKSCKSFVSCTREKRSGGGKKAAAWTVWMFLFRRGKKARDNFFPSRVCLSYETEEKLRLTQSLVDFSMFVGRSVVGVGGVCMREGERVRVYRKQPYFNFCLFALIHFALCSVFSRPRRHWPVSIFLNLRPCSTLSFRLP